MNLVHHCATRMSRFALALCVGSAVAAPLTKGPYLQAPGPTAMTVMWETHANEPGLLRFGEADRRDRTIGPIKPTAVQSGDQTFYVFEANLTGLKPNTAYSYEAQAGGDRSGPRRFKTFGTNQDKVSFIAYGDTRTNPDKHKGVVAHFERFAPEFILHSGDLVAKGKEYDLWAPQFFEPLANIIDHVPMLPSIGNHEQDGANYLVYFHQPGSKEFFYSCDIGPVHVITLDSRLPKPADDQFQFVAADLRASRAPWKVVLLHHPVFNLGAHATLWGHENYLPLFRETKVDIVFAGHSHLYERFRPLRPKNQPDAWAIQHITTGGGGAPLGDTVADRSLAATFKVHHFVAVTATRDTFEARAIDIDGRGIDAFTLRKGPDGRQPADYLASAYAEEDVVETNKKLPRKPKKTTAPAKAAAAAAP